MAAAIAECEPCIVTPSQGLGRPCAPWPQAGAGFIESRPMHIHILGICGTFMGGLAALAREAGHR
ncbi:MAG TPA: hypothetical protein PLL92_04015, partial [Alicycliphilus sp.]|nr:hypothetical protein [Alicycliphilus sp.]